MAWLRTSWLSASLAILWVAIFALTLYRSGAWSPDHELLQSLGGFVPGRVRLGEWPPILLHPFLHASILDLLLDLWIALWAGRRLERLVGPARTWIVLLTATATGALTAAWLTTGLAANTLQVGAWFGILGWVGGLGVLAFADAVPDARSLRRTTIVFVVLAGGLSIWLGGSLWGMAGGLAGGAVVMLLLGPRRVGTKAGPIPVLLALLLLGALVASGVAQAQADDRPDGNTFRAFFQEVEDMDRLADRLYERPDLARPEKRLDLGRRLDALLRAPDLDGRPEASAFRTYLEALRPVATGDVPDPFGFEQRRDAARRAWRKAARTLRTGSGR